MIQPMPSSKTSSPVVADLSSINELQSVIDSVIKSKVCELEMDAMNASEQGFHDQSKQIKHAAREVELLRWKVHSTFSAVFMDSLDAMFPSLKSEKVASVELPNLTPLSPVEVV